jgi:hypothetical protein
VKGATLAGFLLFAAACSKLPSVDNGIVAIQVTSPVFDTLRRSDSLRLMAQAVNSDGSAVAGAAIVWATADTLLATVDADGLVHSLSDTGVARLQASIGTLRSDLIFVTLRADSDTTATLGTRIIP